MESNRTVGIAWMLRSVCMHEARQTDGQLLGRFLAGRDEAAFAALVRRHGPMVYGAAIKPVKENPPDFPDLFGRTFWLTVGGLSGAGRIIDLAYGPGIVPHRRVC